MGIPQHTLNDGTALPAIGFGTYPLRGRAGIAAMSDAIAAGYRPLDSAFHYDDEGAVGAAVRTGGVPREEIVVRLEREAGVVPSVNQVELHPWLPQVGQQAYHGAHGIRTEAWAPVGEGSGLRDEPVIAEIAATHGVIPTQVILRWDVERGVVPLPRSASPDHRRENLDVFGFALAADEVAALTALGRAHRLFGADPATHEEF